MILKTFSELTDLYYSVDSIKRTILLIETKCTAYGKVQAKKGAKSKQRRMLKSKQRRIL